MASSEQKPGFVIKDRRTFAASSDADERPTEAPAAEPPAETGQGTQEQQAGGERPLPPVDFSTFVLSLGSSALMHLGEIEHPGSGRPEKDLPMAKHTIDLLSLLQAKTKGNLTSQEEELIESLLYDLRLRYVTAAKTR